MSEQYFRNILQVGSPKPLQMKWKDGLTERQRRMMTRVERKPKKKR